MTPQQQLEIDRILKASDAPAALIIMVNANGETESVVSGGLQTHDGKVLMGSELAFTLLYWTLADYTEEIFGNMPAALQAQARATLPTRETAEKLGIWTPRGFR